jgi:acetoin utilization deacetylase AcuC-like enzyme
MAGRARSALAAVRPPGHHAEVDRAMGFCLFNNVAIGAAAARALGAARVAIVDWDVHHGNGTQAMFYTDPTVQFLSVHQHPFYPGTGAADEIGAGAGLRTTVNVPLPAGCGDREYIAVFDELLVPTMRSFAPDIIFVSAGFDAHTADPLASMELSTAGYAAIARRVCRLAEEVCEGRLVAVLEGGYDLVGLGDGVAAMVGAMESVQEPTAPAIERPEPGVIAPGARSAIERARRAREAA